jgi:uncharacterized protein
VFAVAPNLSMAPRLGVVGWTIVVVATGYLAALAWQGRRSFLELRLERPTHPGALLVFYRRNVTRKIGMLLPVALLLMVVPGLRPAQLGLAWPHGPSVGERSRFFVFLVVSILVTGLWWRRMARRGESVPRPPRLEILVPVTRAERRWAVAASISAGICEELMFRGVLIMAGIAAGWPPVIAALVSSVLFGLAHLYQGWFGMLLTAVLGLAMTYFVLPTGSLLFPIVLHILIDLRGLVIVPAVAISPEPVQRGTVN